LRNGSEHEKGQKPIFNLIHRSTTLQTLLFTGLSYPKDAPGIEYLLHDMMHRTLKAVIKGSALQPGGFAVGPRQSLVTGNQYSLN